MATLIAVAVITAPVGLMLALTSGSRVAGGL
jgi:hypothetical protein